MAMCALVCVNTTTQLYIPAPIVMMAWFAYAADAFPSARFIAKADDDVYVQAPHFERMLRSVAAASSADAAAMMYLGVMSFFHWYPTNFEREGFGYHFMMSHQAGATCRAAQRCAACGACLGPFRFAAGYLVLLGAPLVRELVADARVQV